MPPHGSSTAGAELAPEVREAIWRALEEVYDPEIPNLSVVDLGIVRRVAADADGTPVVTITPTYTGCPATQVIALAVRAALDRAGFRHARLETALAPPWTTDWITERGRERLREAGIAPPLQSGGKERFGAPPEVPCPRCGSAETECIAEFGATACKALYRCRGCLEPFEYFKCL